MRAFLWRDHALAVDPRAWRSGDSCYTIEEAPTFGWRGGMLDSARQFDPLGFVKALTNRVLDRLTLAGRP